MRARKWYPTVSLARENPRRPLPLWWSLKMRKWVFSHKIWVLFKWLLFLISVQLFGSHGGDPHFFESRMLWVQVSKVGLPNVRYEHFTPQVCKAPSSWIPFLIMGCCQGWKRGGYGKTGSLPLLLAQYGFFSSFAWCEWSSCSTSLEVFFQRKLFHRFGVLGEGDEFRSFLSSHLEPHGLTEDTWFLIYI